MKQDRENEIEEACILQKEVKPSHIVKKELIKNFPVFREMENYFPGEMSTLDMVYLSSIVYDYDDENIYDSYLKYHNGQNTLLSEKIWLTFERLLKLFETEVWRPIRIEGYREKYMVSTKGRVKNTETWNILSQTPNNGYLRVALNNNKKPKTLFIHRLVALTFLLKQVGKEHVNHIDGNRSNNNISNLEWISPSGNSIHAIRTGLSTPLTRKIGQYDLTGKLIRKYSSIKKAAIRNGYDSSCLSRTCKGKQKTAYGYIWKYINYKPEVVDPKDLKNYKKVKNFPNYLISPTGKVFSKSLNRHMSLCRNKKGYAICLSNKNIKHTWKIAKLVAMYFVKKNHPDDNSVRHIDKNIYNDNANNLEWYH